MDEDGGEEDLAKYLLYRNSTLIHGGEYYEKTVLVARSVGVVVDIAWHKSSQYETQANNYFKLAAAAALFGLLDVAAAMFVMAHYYRGLKGTYETLAETASSIMAGENEIKEERNRRMALDLEDWIEKRDILQEERRVLNMMLYGSAVYPGGADGVLPPLVYNRFTGGVGYLYGIGQQGVNATEIRNLYTQEIFDASKAGEEGSILEAIATMNRYIALEYAKSGFELEQKSRDCLEVSTNCR